MIWIMRRYKNEKRKMEKEDVHEECVVDADIVNEKKMMLFFWQNERKKRRKKRRTNGGGRGR